MTKPILALNSIRGKSGKDTLIEHIEANGLKVHRVAFADTLKRLCAETLAGSPGGRAVLLEKEMHTSVKDTPKASLAIANLPVSPYKAWAVDRFDVREERSLRWHLQQYGTGYRREFLGKPNVWLDMGCLEVEEGLSDPSVDVVVVTDMRLPNEYERMSREGAHLIRIVRNWHVPEVDTVPYHISDIALMAHAFDALVVNEWGKPAAMYDQIKRFL
ncbi:hypothetical protein [Pseudomonas guariconensis]|uniref:hypothetical protein n=1 Tax=Pseudomonas guariconensis TaxID=1288410 RepID=UPI002B06104C|nr:hypothetical protein [Pseudomonas guariconensis]